MKSVLRASRIGRVLLRYRLDDLLEGTPVERWLRLARPGGERPIEPPPLLAGVRRARAPAFRSLVLRALGCFLGLVHPWRVARIGVRARIS